MGSNASHAVLSGFDAHDDDVLHLSDLEDAELQAHWHALSTPAIGVPARAQASLAASQESRPAHSGARAASPWRRLKWFWTVLLVTAATGAALLQVLGPPGPSANLPPQARANAEPLSAERGPESTVAPSSPGRPALSEAPRANKPPEAAALSPVPLARVTEDRTQVAVPAAPGIESGANPVGNPGDKPGGNPADKREATASPPAAREAKPPAPEPPAAERIARASPAQPTPPQPATDSATRDINAAIAAITAAKPRADVAKQPPSSDNAPDLSVHYLAGSDADARRLAGQLGSMFERRSIHTEAEVPRVAVVRFFQPSDHATARTVGKALGDMGYTWRIENQSSAGTGLPGTIDVWLPSK